MTSTQPLPDHLTMLDAVVSRVRPASADQVPAVVTIPARVLAGVRDRRYDGLVLAYVARHHVVRHHQVHSFITASGGIGSEYVARVIRRLVQAGLLTSSRLPPGGPAQPGVVELTRRGYGVLRLRPPQESERWRASMLPYRLQFADMLLQRTLEGLRFMNAGEGAPILRQWALRQYAGRALTGYEPQDRDRLKRLPPIDPTLPLLVNDEATVVRLILPARPGLDPRGLLERIPAMPFHPPLTFELVCAKQDAAAGYLDRAKRAVQWWSAQRRQPALWTCAAAWQDKGTFIGPDVDG